MESTHTYRNQNVYMSIRMDSMDYTKLSKHMHLKYITSVTIGTVMFNWEGLLKSIFYFIDESQSP